MNAIIKLKNLFSSGKGNGPYPYTFFNELYSVKFNINNNIEEFRLKDWGGEKEYVVEMISDLQADDTFYDIGSSVGLISIIAAKVLTKGQIISFEPDPENLSRLKMNYEINELTNFIIKSIAVGTEKSTMQLYTAGSGAFSPSLQKVNGIDNNITVEVNSIDNLLKSESIPVPTAIKIDIEGAEMMALKGMENLLKSKQRPRILFIELHPEFLPAFNTSVEDIFTYLSKFDYKIESNIKREKQILCKLVCN